jgi:hypothetical protein
VDLHDLFYVEVYYTCLRSSGIRYVVPYRVHVEAKFFCANVTIIYHPGHALAQSVEALRYKPEGRGFDSRWCHWDFSFT